MSLCDQQSMQKIKVSKTQFSGWRRVSRTSTMSWEKTKVKVTAMQKFLARQLGVIIHITKVPRLSTTTMSLGQHYRLLTRFLEMVEDRVCSNRMVVKARRTKAKFQTQD